MKWLERGGIVVAALAIAIGVIALLSGGLAGSRDDPGINTGTAPGTAYHELGDRRLAPGVLRPAYSSNPPTSGAHVALAITRQGETVSDDQLLEALSVGDVVLMYPQVRPPAELRAIAAATAPPFSAPLARVGQAVILAHRPGLGSVTALAWGHLLRGGAAGPTLAFTRYWLGRRTPGNATGSVAGQG